MSLNIIPAIIETTGNLNLTCATPNIAIFTYVSRLLISGIYKINPIYKWIEIPERFIFKELLEKYKFKESEERFLWKVGEKLYQFKLGEEKEVGGQISLNRGIKTTYFSLSATYEYKNSIGTLLDEGIANIDGSNVFVLLAPTVVGKQFVYFTITITPTDASGNVDVSRLPEIMKEEVLVYVK